MGVPVDVLHWVCALMPIITLVILMMVFHWRATEAAPIGIVVAAVVALIAYKADSTVIAVECVKGIWSALVVIIVILPAIFLYEISSEANAFQIIQTNLQKLLPNELLQILGIGLGFVGFLIGVTGFGVPVAVGAPLLVGMGMNPLFAVIISLLGESWGSTFGTLAVAWDAMALAAGLNSDTSALLVTALSSALLIWIWNLIIGMSICWLYGKWEGIKKGFPAVIVISIVQGGGQVLVSQINQTIACFLPACAALVAIFVLGRTSMYRDAWSIENSPIMNRSKMHEKIETEAKGSMSLLQAFLPYILLTAITLTVLLISPLKAFLGQVKLGFALPQTVTGYGYTIAASEKYSPISPFTHASLFLLISAIVGLAYYVKNRKIKKDSCAAIVRRSVNKMIPSGLSVICFLVMSRIMSGSGQTTVLASGMAAVMGKFYVLFAPIIGLLGAFMTSSNMASNILFSEFQLTTANILGVKSSIILAGQTAGGAIGTATCPGNIILGCTTTGIIGNEGNVLKKTLPLSIAAAVLIGLIVAVVVVLSV